MQIGSGSPTTTWYVVDKNRDYAQVLEERDASGALAVRYVYGLDLIAQVRGTNPSYYHYDGLGSTRQLTDNPTNPLTDKPDVLNSYTYEAFGRRLESGTGDQVDNSYRFTGEQYDQQSGQYYLRARYYQPGTGRFTGRDAADGSTSDPLALHKYLYGGADPVNKIDPTGRNFISVGATTAIITTLVGSIVGGAIGAASGNVWSGLFIGAGIGGAIGVALATGRLQAVFFDGLVGGLLNVFVSAILARVSMQEMTGSQTVQTFLEGFAASALMSAIFPFSAKKGAMVAAEFQLAQSIACSLYKVITGQVGFSTEYLVSAFASAVLSAAVTYLVVYGGPVIRKLWNRIPGSGFHGKQQFLTDSLSPKKGSEAISSYLYDFSQPPDRSQRAF